jgi:hypothetical protein
MAQLYNDGAEITIQTDAFVHVQGDFINQGGIIFNDGLIELGGNWFNTVMTNPLNPGSGEVDMVGTDQTIGGDFNTLFNFLSLRDAQNLSLDATAGVENEFNLNNGTLTLNRNTLHLLSPLSTALSSNTGGILAETTDVYGFVRWDIGTMTMGVYRIPFINTFGTSIPTSIELTGPGDVDTGYMLFSTYATNVDNSPFPIDVTNINLPGNDAGQRMVDRFWIASAENYNSSPTANITLSFDDMIETGGSNEIDLAAADLEILNWDGVDTWSTLESNANSLPSVSTNNLSQYGNFAIWSPLTTSVIDRNKLVTSSIYPNPSSDVLTLEFDARNSEEIALYIVDHLGRNVRRSSSTITTGLNKLSVSIRDLPNGSYQLLLIGDNINAVESFIKI